MSLNRTWRDKLKSWSWPQADVSLPFVLLKSIWYHLHGKPIIADFRTMIRGLSRIEIDGRLIIGKVGGILHRKDWTSINVEGKLIIKGGVHIGKGCRIHVCEGGELVLEDCHLTGLSTVVVKNYLKIGKGCVVAWNTEFIDWGSHKIIYEGHEEKKGRIEIGEKVWIASGVKILGEVSIGSGSVVAANAVVTRSFPENVLIAGSPAKIVREGVSWENYE
ncbi:MAG: acyltransferase [Verrucomicrobiota bacterium]